MNVSGRMVLFGLLGSFHVGWTEMTLTRWVRALLCVRFQITFKIGRANGTAEGDCLEPKKSVRV